MKSQKIKLLLAFCIGFLVLSPELAGIPAARASNVEKEQKWNAATLAYQINDYAKARRLYEDLLNEGMANPELYFNLGNTYYQQGEKGLAAWMYEKAIKIRPRHADARRNLRLLQANTPGEKNENGTLFLLLPFSWIYGLFSVNEWVVALEIVYFFAGASVILWLLLRNPVIRRRMRWGAVSGLLLVVLVSAFALPRLISSEYRSYGTVIGKGTIVRSAPGPNEPEYFGALEGERYEVQEANVQGWMRVKRSSDGRVGYLPESIIKKI